MVLEGYRDFSLQPARTPGQQPGGDAQYFVHFRLSTDVSKLFPYINSMAEAAGYFPKLPFIRFVLERFCCGLHPTHGVCASFTDRLQAVNFLETLLAFLHEASHSRGRCEPSYRAWEPLPVLQIFKLLPRNNCGVCGYASCLAFAVAVSRRQTGPEGCPGFRRPIHIQAIYPLTDHRGDMVGTVTLDLDPSRDGQLAGTGCAGRPKVAPPGKAAAFRPQLSVREEEVLCLLAQGATNPEIAVTLGISPHTVKSHVLAIFNKLAVNDRTQAAVWAVRHNLI